VCSLALLVLLALTVSGVALAARGDPQRRITRADQARAKAMLLRPSDFSVAFVASPRTSGRSDFYCAAIDESDLTVTGNAESPNFTAAPESVTSTSYVYASRSDSNASWKRGTSPAGRSCLRDGVRREIARAGVRLLSFKTVPFPRRGDRSIAFRTVAALQGIRIFVDQVAVQVGRAQLAVTYTSALSPPPQGELRRLTRAVAARATRAMRGAS
jgi:hypothetical protein